MLLTQGDLSVAAWFQRKFSPQYSRPVLRGLRFHCIIDILFQDIIDRVCIQEDLRIVPIARQFFALCDPKTGLPISPYRTLTPEESRKKYQLRVIVNTGENSFQFMRMSKTAYGYYYAQVCKIGSGEGRRQCEYVVE